ncbi:MAG: hypothetical protein ABIQ99_18205 [Thermoflexales bacterium]
MADLSPSQSGLDTAYVADDATGLIKWSLVGSSWITNSVTGVDADDYRGVTGIVSGTSVTLFATRGGNQLVVITDTSGYNAAQNGTPVLMSTAGTNKAYRGVALAPVSVVALMSQLPLAFRSDP